MVLSAAVPPIAEPSAELDSCRVCSPRFLAADTESLTKETGSKSRRPVAALEIALELSLLIPPRRLLKEEEYRKSVVEGKSVAGRIDQGGRRNVKKKKKKELN